MDEKGTSPMGSLEKISKKTYRSNSKVCKGCPVRDACAAAPVGTLKIEPLEYLA